MSLVKKWKAPNSNRQVGQISFRPALHILAKLNALTDMYDRNKTEIINDLLDQAFDVVEEELKGVDGYRNEKRRDEENCVEYEERVYNSLEVFDAYEKKYQEQLEKLRGESTESK